MYDEFMINGWWIIIVARLQIIDFNYTYMLDYKYVMYVCRNTYLGNGGLWGTTHPHTQ